MLYSWKEEDRKYLALLSEKYPTLQAVCTEIINLQAILNLPKGTEHFMSDLHGEYEAFYHILNNCSGVVREKVDLVFSNTLNKEERSELCTLIYYPEKKLKAKKEKEGGVSDEWYKKTLYRMIDVCKVVASKYTRSKVRKALPKEYSYIIDELLHAQPDEDNNQLVYHSKIMDTIIGINNADEFIIALAGLIKRLAVDRLHIVGDIFDRGPRADSIVELLTQHHAVDVEWGNHDILWMGAASGCEACMATVVKNSVSANNISVLENGYGISLRNLAVFAKEAYPRCKDLQKATLLAITVIMLKLEGQLILRHPEYRMEARRLLHKIDFATQTVEIEGKRYKMSSCYFPTLQEDPYMLTPQEQQVMDDLKRSFRESERLHRHIQFLYARGSIYKCFNQNLLFHGCIPMQPDGSLTQVEIEGEKVCGKRLMDKLEKLARKAYFMPEKDPQKQFYTDYMWYLWCGKDSPLFGRAKMTAFERMFLTEKSTWEEQKNPYYERCNSEKFCLMLLQEFGLCTPFSHIINGHVPVRANAGESPVKGNGRLIVIDGGFCRAYHKTTGIAGYTLIYNSHGMRILSHQPFESAESAIENNADIESRSDIFETQMKRVMVMDTDVGNAISNRIYDLSLLRDAYRQGILIPKGKI